jgi:hypothetical protein
LSAITKLIRVTASRNARKDYTDLKIRVLKSDLLAFKEQLAKDRLSATVFFEAMLRGYAERHPAILAMISDWLKSEKKDGLKDKSETARLSQKDLNRLLDDIESADSLDDLEEENVSE